MSTLEACERAALETVAGLPRNANLRQAADALGISVDVMRAGIAQGVLPGTKAGERFVIPRLALAVFLLTGRTPEVAVGPMPTPVRDIRFGGNRRAS